MELLTWQHTLPCQLSYGAFTWRLRFLSSIWCRRPVERKPHIITKAIMVSWLRGRARVTLTTTRRQGGLLLLSAIKSESSFSVPEAFLRLSFNVATLLHVEWPNQGPVLNGMNGRVCLVYTGMGRKRRLYLESWLVRGDSKQAIGDRKGIIKMLQADAEAANALCRDIINAGGRAVFMPKVFRQEPDTSYLRR